MSQISSFLTGLIARKNSETTNKRKSFRSRILNLEALESRELLDAAPIAGLDAASIKDSPAILCDNLLDDTAPIDLSNVESESTTWIVTSAEDTESEGSLRYAINHVQDGDTITFDATLKGESITINPNLGELVLNKSVTIDATSVSDAESSVPGITIDGQGESGILRVAPNETGGAIDLVINWVAFADGKAENGAAINLDDVVVNSTFNNCAFWSNVAEEFGGAIYNVNNDAAININNCDFSGNSAVFGGAVYNSAALNIDNGVFTSNYAYETGGAISSGGDTTLNDVEFISNGGGEGGAISRAWDSYDQNATMNINNCKFESNFADGDDYDGLGYGGAIIWYGSMTISGGEFTDNGARYGGAIDSGGSVIIENAAFSGNYAASVGGAISCDSDGEIIEMTNCEFVNNSADKYGGAIYSGSDMTLNDVEFISNGAGAGGAIAVASYYDALNGVTLYNLNATINNCKFESNYANGDDDDGLGDGGAIQWHGSMTISGGEFTDNFASCLGGAIDFSGESFIIENTLLSGNYAASEGGAISFSSGEMAMTNCVVADNVAEADGGAIFITGGNGAEATLTNCTITGNTAFEGGGVSVCCNSTLTSYNTIICGNEASESGADVYVMSGSDSFADSSAYGHNTLSSFTSWNDGSNNLTYDAAKPLFTDAENGDYTLASNSQAIDKGNVAYVATEVDLAGNPRVSGATVDLGAYEFQASSEPEVLSTPANPRVTAKTDTSVTVAWDAVENASQYGLIYKKSTDDSYTVVKLDAGTTSYELTDLDSAAKYYWKVRALGDGADYLNSGYVPTQTIRWNEPVKLSTPANLRVTAKTDTSITVAWDAAENASQYGLIYRKTTDSSYTVVKLDADTTSYTLADLDSASKYYWKVRALGDGYEYLNSDYAPTQTIKWEDPVKLLTPANPRVTSKTAAGVTVEWDAVENASQYGLIYRKTTDSSYTVVKLDADTTSYTLADLDKTAKYYWKVRALGDGYEYLNSDYVPTQTIKTVNAPVWNLADYPQYKSFKLDATTDSKYTATLYGLEKDGETYTPLQEWDYIGADAAAIVTGRNSVAETLWVTDQAASLLGEIQFNGGESLLDTLQVDGTAGDDEVAISTETVVGASNKKTTYGVVDLNGTPVKFLGASSVALNLDSGDDVIKIDALQYNYAINSTDGANALDFSGASKGLSLDLGVTERQVSLVGDGGTLQLSGDYTTVIGTSKNDRIVGTKAGLTFVGIGGSDSVTLVGGDNNVELNGARQSVTARGDGEYFVAIQNGKGSVVSADGVTKRGHVVVDADGANTTISGGQGALDAVVRGRYATVNAGATTRSTVFIEGKNASVTTGGGDDCVDVVGDYATVTTNGGADYVSITGADSNVHLGQGDDRLFLSDGDSGRVGNHHVWGEAGNDAIFAANTAGENYFYAGAGNDVLVGGAGKDYLYADLGNNVLVGLGGVDRIFGAAGRDLLIGSTTDGAQIEAMDQLEFEEFYAALYQAWDVDGDMDATVALLGEHCVSDAAKDWIYRGGGKNNLVYASELDSDFEDALEKSPYNDELKLD